MYRFESAARTDAGASAIAASSHTDALRIIAIAQLAGRYRPCGGQPLGMLRWDPGHDARSLTDRGDDLETAAGVQHPLAPRTKTEAPWERLVRQPA
jgi:hypothetical protein